MYDSFPSSICNYLKYIFYIITCRAVEYTLLQLCYNSCPYIWLKLGTNFNSQLSSVTIHTQFYDYCGHFFNLFYSFYLFLCRSMCRYPPFRCTCEHTASRANVVYVVNAFLGHGCCKGTSAPTQVSAHL